MKKMKSRSFRILMAAVISAAMLCPQVKISAADGLVSKAVTSYFPSKTVMKKTARKTEPEEWNQKEIKAYKFGTLEDALYYALTGGIKYYDQNYFKNPDLIKLTPVESGALGLAVVGDNKQEAILYDSNKKMIKKLPLSYVKAQVNAGETYYIEFPKNCKEGLITAYVLQNECGGLAKNDLNMQKGEEKAIRQMETWAKDDSHGYDQDYRWGEKGDYDCSSAVIQAWQNAGVPVKSGGATYTGDMKNVFLKNGFKDITVSVNRGTGTGLKRGDVLLNEAHHVAMYCGAGKEVEASINEKGTAHGGQPGDQTGKEFLIRNYRNYPWNCILRYAGDQTVTSDAKKKQNTVAYVARFTKDCKCYSAAGKTQAKMFPVIKKNAVVDVMKYTETVKGKKWYFIRIPHPTEGFVFEFVPAGYFKKLV